MKATFLKSALKPEDWAIVKTDEGKTLPEIAVVGRSNVGKSSLLNHLFYTKKMVRVSARPGKTQLLNFFRVSDNFVLVDCPGYGFAKVPKALQREWGKWVEEYLTKGPRISLILFLLDIRRNPTEEDLAFFEWAAHYDKPIQVVLTKADKVKKQERKKRKDAIMQRLDDEGIEYDGKVILYTIKNNEGRVAVTKLLEELHGPVE